MYIEGSSRWPLYHFRVARGLPAIEVQVSRFKFPAVRISPSSKPCISGCPGGSVRSYIILTIIYIKNINFVDLVNKIIKNGLGDNNNLHMMVKTCDCVLMSFSSEFIALQDIILFRSFGLTKTLIFERVTHPPDGLVTVFVVWMSVGNVRLSTNH